MKFLVMVAAILAWPAAARGATFVVNSTDDAVDVLPGDGVCATSAGVCSLRAAIQEANALTGSQVITLPGGVYTLTIPGAGGAEVGDLDIAYSTFITINGSGASTTIIDANGIDRVFNIPWGILSLTLKDVTVQGGSDGCIRTSSGLTLNRVIIRGCHGGSGGGINTSPMGGLALSIIDTTVTENAGSLGGGLHLGSGTAATIIRSTISHNSAVSRGGGIYATGDDNSATSVTIVNSTIAHNTSASGGALWLADFGPFHGFAQASLVNTTIADNTTTGSGGAIEEFGNLSQPRLSTKNTIVANNAGGAAANCLLTNAATDLGSNLEFPGTSCGFSLPSDRRVDPLLGALGAHGGPTLTMALLKGSPAIDVGDDAACAASPVSGLDQRGVSRSTGAGAHCDMGAFEKPTTFAPFDFTDDGRTDRTVFRPSTGIWYVLDGSDATATRWGVASDVDVPGDYDGDGQADLAVWRPSNGVWYIVDSSDNTVQTEFWGVAGDVPLAGDVDGDGKADLVIWRPSTGTWFVKESGGGTRAATWGISGDQPLLADFDGDGKADFVIYRPSAGAWFVLLSGGGSQTVQWGVPTDVPIAGDWDGDGKADAGIFRPSTGQWLINASSGVTIVVNWGVPGDVPLAGDWDSDGKSDFTLWRPSTGIWYTQLSAGGVAAVAWGTTGDRPAGRTPGSQ